MCDYLGAGELRGEGLEDSGAWLSIFSGRGVRIGDLFFGRSERRGGNCGTTDGFAGGSVKRGVGIARMNALSVCSSGVLI